MPYAAVETESSAIDDKVTDESNVLNLKYLFSKSIVD